MRSEEQIVADRLHQPATAAQIGRVIVGMFSGWPHRAPLSPDPAVAAETVRLWSKAIAKHVDAREIDLVIDDLMENMDQPPMPSDVIESGYLLARRRLADLDAEHREWIEKVGQPARLAREAEAESESAAALAARRERDRYLASCMCDGRGVVPGNAGFPIPCPDPRHNPIIDQLSHGGERKTIDWDAVHELADKIKRIEAQADELPALRARLADLT